jgi:Na+-driven multidrug efflux pump
MMIVEAVMVYVINIAFVRYLTPEHFEAYATVNIIMILFYSIYMGATTGLQPKFSQMMGRYEFDSLKSLIAISIGESLKYGILVYLALITFIEGILSLFLESESSIAIAKVFYYTLGFATLLSNYPLQMSIFYTAINRPLESSMISIMRTFVLIPPLVFIFIKYTGTFGVALGFIITDCLMILAISIYMKKRPLAGLEVKL